MKVSSNFKFLKILFLIILPLTMYSCTNPFKDIDWSETQEPMGKKRARANAEAGAGLGSGELFKKGRGGSTNFEFASSNPLWRASLDTLDFLVFDTVDYSGGILITDWYSENDPNEAIKITVRFLTNEIRVDAIDVAIHKRKCFENKNCLVNKIDSDLIFDIKDKILRTAARIQVADKNKELETIKKKRGRIGETYDERYDN